MNKILTDDEIKKVVNEIVEEYLKSLGESSSKDTLIQPKKDIKMSKNTITSDTKKKLIDQTASVSQDNKINQTNQTILKPKNKAAQQLKASIRKENKSLSQLSYRIFSIKMRLGKLGLNDTLRRFAQSLHDFDINVTKNSTNFNEIKSYLSPAQGNLVALKGALESLEAEFKELEKLLNDK